MVTGFCYNPVMIDQLIRNEKFTNIQNAQAGLTRLFAKAAKSKSFYRVLKNDKALGVLIPNEMWEDWLEDWEAANSPNYLKSIVEARKSKNYYDWKEVKKMLDL